LPLLGWKAGATRLPGPLYWHGAAARIGLFAPLVLLAEIIGIDWLRGVNSPGGLTWLDPRTLLCWVAAILLLSAGWQAWRSRSAGAVLSWLALSQTGFILLALLVGGAFGTASGLLLLFSLGLAEAVLAGLCLVAVPLGNASPTGEANHLNLQRLALGAAVLAAASLIGLPPTLGFVAKWLLYDGLFMEVTLGWNRWLLLLAAVLGSLFSVMALLRLTGIMRAAIRERDPGDLPYGVMAPILGLSALTLLAGVLPGPAMGWVAAMQQALGVESLNWSLSGVREHFDMLWISVGQLLLLIPVILWWRARSTDPR
jgi:formate hydrogenlyase subunit 3/multisubunit Na+/H+ antiporter MnhD subunit